MKEEKKRIDEKEEEASKNYIKFVCNRSQQQSELDWLVDRLAVVIVVVIDTRILLLFKCAH